MKLIIVQWVVDSKLQYGREMRVIQSNHYRFKVGHRFDWGFFGIATEEGYNIISLNEDYDYVQFKRELKLDYLLPE